LRQSLAPDCFNVQNQQLSTSKAIEKVPPLVALFSWTQVFSVYKNLITGSAVWAILHNRELNGAMQFRAHSVSTISVDQKNW